MTQQRESPVLGEGGVKWGGGCGSDWGVGEGRETGFVPFFASVHNFSLQPQIAEWRGAQCREWSETGGQTGPSWQAGRFLSPAEGTRQCVRACHRCVGAVGSGGRGGKGDVMGDENHSNGKRQRRHQELRNQVLLGSGRGKEQRWCPPLSTPAHYKFRSHPISSAGQHQSRHPGLRPCPSYCPAPKAAFPTPSHSVPEVT